MIAVSALVVGLAALGGNRDIGIAIGSVALLLGAVGLGRWYRLRFGPLWVPAAIPGLSRFMLGLGLVSGPVVVFPGVIESDFGPAGTLIVLTFSIPMAGMNWIALMLLGSATVRNPRPDEGPPEPGPKLLSAARVATPIEAETLRSRLAIEGVAAIIHEPDVAHLRRGKDPAEQEGIHVLVEAGDVERAHQIKLALDRGEFALDEGENMDDSNRS